MSIISVPDDLPAVAADDLLLHDYVTTRATERVSRTRLTRHTFSLLREGGKTIWLPGETLRLTGPEGVLLAAGHCLMAERLAAPHPRYRSTLLCFTDAHLWALHRKYPDVFPVGAPVPDPASGFTFGFDPFLTQFVAALTDGPSLPPAIGRALLQVRFEELMLYLAGRYPRAFPAFVATLLGPAPVRSLRQVVESPASARRTLDELAFLCHMSVSTFKRRFEAQYGVPPTRWFHERRMREAAFRLRHEQARASEIHAELGYESLSSFIQAFKKTYGLTPKAYQAAG